MHTMTQTDWYQKRDELRPGMVFKCYDGIVKLDRTVPGDATKWYTADWWNGWSYMDSTIEPGDLIERLPDDYSGKAA
jgi:hypothetical protein